MLRAADVTEPCQPAGTASQPAHLEYLRAHAQLDVFWALPICGFSAEYRPRSIPLSHSKPPGSLGTAQMRGWDAASHGRLCRDSKECLK
jgi:hypothetical protein